MSDSRVGVWAIVWSNPHKPRPEGQPEVFLELRTPLAKGQGAGAMPAEIQDCYDELSPYGYAVCWWTEGGVTRRLSLETKQKIRRGNLRKRLDRRWPMFAEDLYREALARKPEYYGSA